MSWFKENLKWFGIWLFLLLVPMIAFTILFNYIEYNQTLYFTLVTLWLAPFFIRALYKYVLAIINEGNL